MSKKFYQELIDQKIYPRQLGGQNIPLQEDCAQTIIDFTSNDYLGINHNPDIQKHIKEWLIHRLQQSNWQIGATGSRMISGNSPAFEAFEKSIAIAKHQASALILNSGYQANSTILAALLKPANTYVFCDKLNHASLHHACQLAGVKQHRYPHLDNQALEKKLQQVPLTANKWIVTETIFGMDGDTINLLKIIELATVYQANIYLDEAHATGLFGEEGYGISTQPDVLKALIDFKKQGLEICVMGTLSKALGTSGAYIALSNLLKTYLINYCTGFIYSTAASPLLIELSHEIWRMIPSLFKTYAPNILKNASDFRIALQKIIDAKNWPCQILGTSHITVIRMNNADAYHLEILKKLHQALKNHGIYPSMILPPTSPLPSLRFAFCAMHQSNDIAKILQTFTNDYK
jgi:8-amino-7-oxononanoate synthase